MTKDRWILVGFVILAFFLPLGIVPLFDLDEGAFSEATREMLLNHNYITTYLNGDLRFDKPILIYWLQAISVSIFGLNEFALRLPSAIAGAFWAGSIYWFSKRYFDEKIAFLATIFMVGSIQIGIIAKAAIADSLLNMFIAFSMFSIWLYLDTKNKKYLYLAFAFIGFGTLTKGPVAIMIPMVVTFIYLAVKKDLKLFFKMIFDIKGIFIFLIIALPWYMLEYMDQGMKFIDGFILKHNLQRFDSSLEHHKGSIFYFIPVILIGLMPFSVYFIKIFTKLKEIFKNDMFLFLFIWFSFVFIFFSFSGTKLPHYVIYGYTPLFIFMAYYFKNVDKYVIISAVIFLILLFFFPDIALYIKDKIKDEYVKVMIENVNVYFNLDYKILIGFGILVLFSLFFIKISDKIKLLILGIVFIVEINFVIVPAYANIAQKPIKEAALLAKQNGYNVVMYGINMPSFSVYSQSIVKRKYPKAGDIVITKVTKLKKIKDYIVLYQKNGIYLIKVKK